MRGYIGDAARKIRHNKKEETISEDKKEVNISKNKKDLEEIKIVPLVQETMKLENDVKNTDINFKMIKEDRLKIENKFNELKKANKNTPEAPTLIHPSVINVEKIIEGEKDSIKRNLKKIFKKLNCKEPPLNLEINGEGLSEEIKKELNDCLKKSKNINTKDNSYEKKIIDFGASLEKWAACRFGSEVDKKQFNCKSK